MRKTTLLLLEMCILFVIAVPFVQGQVITVGDTSCSVTCTSVPVEPFYNYSETQYIIPAGELATAGINLNDTFYTIGWYLCAEDIDAADHQIQVYLSEVPDPYPQVCTTPQANGILVYSGPLGDCVPTGCCSVTMSTPYIYGGENLVVSVCDTGDGFSAGSGRAWAGNSDTGNGMYRRNDSSGAYDCDPTTADLPTQGCCDSWTTTCFDLSPQAATPTPTVTPTATPTLPPPPGDTCAEAIPISCGDCVNGYTIGGALDHDCGTGHAGADVVYELVMTEDATVTFVGEADFDADWTIATTCDGSTGDVQCVDYLGTLQSTSCSTVSGPSNASRFTTTEALTAGTYFIWVDGYYTSSEGYFSLEISCITGPTPTPTQPPTPTPYTACLTTINSYPYAEDFESGTIGDWTQLVGDDFDWNLVNTATGSTGTGPSGDHTSGSGYYIYTEATGEVEDDEAHLYGVCFDLSALTSPELRFYYHMYGAGMGTINVDVTTDDGASWTNAWTLSGDQGDIWTLAAVDLSTYAGQTIGLRFVGIIGPDYTSDAAIDDITLGEAGAPTPTPTTTPTPCNVACPGSADVEAEVCGNDENGGCLLTTPAFETLTPGTPFCGTLWSSTTTRDTDWFEVITTAEWTEFTMAATAEMEVLFGGIGMNPCFEGSADCTQTTGSVAPYAITSACVTDSVTVTVPAGTHWFFIAPANFEDNACTSGNNDYVIDLTSAPGTAPADYCTVEATGEDEYISNVLFNTIDNTTGWDGYGDYTTISTDVEVGATHTITVTLTGSYALDEGAVYIDWNQDLDFCDADEAIAMNGSPGVGPYTADITIPAHALLGSTRMRVAQNYDDPALQCGSTDWGDYEDYSINVTSSGPTPTPEPIPSTGPAGVGILLLVIGSFIALAGLSRKN